MRRAAKGEMRRVLLGKDAGEAHSWAGERSRTQEASGRRFSNPRESGAGEKGTLLSWEWASRLRLQLPLQVGPLPPCPSTATPGLSSHQGNIIPGVSALRVFPLKCHFSINYCFLHVRRSMS